MPLAFHAELLEVVRGDFPPSEPCWDVTAFKPYLKATRLGPLDGEIKKLADKITRGKRTVQAKARAIYDWTRSNMYRDPNTKGCATGDVCALLQKRGGNCTDISSVYIAPCRAAAGRRVTEYPRIPVRPGGGPDHRLARPGQLQIQVHIQREIAANGLTVNSSSSTARWCKRPWGAS
jgi:hypothetical protein